MDLEEQILPYYLRVFSVFLTIFLLLFFLYFSYVLNRTLNLNKNKIIINKGETLEYVLRKNISDLSFLDLKLIKIYFKISSLFKKNYIHYGDFNFQNDTSISNFLKIISNPSNIFDKITIIEGWSANQLNLELSNYYDEFYTIPYTNIIADTYLIQKNTNFDSLIKQLHNFKKNYFIKYQKNKLFNFFTQEEIMIIGSLLEKEGLDSLDKKKISSVIFNRLEKNMKLQIDATVIYSITNGNYNLQRKLLLRDLKIDHPYNTYMHKGLPPKPISYVGKKTLDLLFENYQTEFLFYFFDKSLNKHIFSKTYKEHKQKLNEYRNEK